MFPFTLHQLRILKTVATEKSFIKASEILYLSQPALSKQIKTLEKNLDSSLINRQNNKISLTQNGKIFLMYSERILGLCEDSYRALTDLKNGDHGKLIIGVNETIGRYLIPQILALFAQNYPQINFKVQFNSTRVVAQDIINEEIDLGIVEGYVPKKFKNKLTMEYFVQDNLRLILSKLHPFAERKKIILDDLYDLNFITLNSNSTIQKFMDTILKQNNIKTKQLKIVMQLNSIEGIKTAVSLGLGAAFVSSAVIEKEIELEKLVILKIHTIKITRILSIISNPKCYKSKTFELFYNELCSLKSNMRFKRIT